MGKGRAGRVNTVLTMIEVSAVLSRLYVRARRLILHPLVVVDHGVNPLHPLCKYGVILVSGDVVLKGCHLVMQGGCGWPRICVVVHRELDMVLQGSGLCVKRLVVPTFRTNLPASKT